MEGQHGDVQATGQPRTQDELQESKCEPKFSELIRAAASPSHSGTMNDDTPSELNGNASDVSDTQRQPKSRNHGDVVNCNDTIDEPCIGASGGDDYMTSEMNGNALDMSDTRGQPRSQSRCGKVNCKDSRDEPCVGASGDDGMTCEMNGNALDMSDTQQHSEDHSEKVNCKDTMDEPCVGTPGDRSNDMTCAVDGDDVSDVQRQPFSVKDPKPVQWCPVSPKLVFL